MLDKVKNIILKAKLLHPKQKVLVAVSGGVDSIVLLDVLQTLKYDCIIAHVNFKLRGEASDEEEEFVRSLAKSHNFKCFTTSFDTLSIAKKQRVSVEMAARDLRYEWFDKLCNENKISAIVTGHHRDDQLETFMMNLVRGSGLKGLSAMKEKNGKVIRPLLGVARHDILKYANQRHLSWREDLSNNDETIRRNHYRHTILPVLRTENPSLDETLIRTIRKVKESREIVEAYVDLWRKTLIKVDGNCIKIPIFPLQNAPGACTLLFELIGPYGFNEAQVLSILESEGHESGKLFYSTQKRLVIDREELIISDLEQLSADYQIEEDLKTSHLPIDLNLNLFQRAGKLKISADKNVASFDVDKIEFPLTLRRWRQGDAFQPFGMRGTKKVSDFFVDQKLSIIEKENIWILCSGNDIVWIVGQRTDDRVKITQSTLRILEVVAQ